MIYQGHATSRWGSTLVIFDSKDHALSIVMLEENVQHSRPSKLSYLKRDPHITVNTFNLCLIPGSENPRDPGNSAR